jgi:hypothetical protein
MLEIALGLLVLLGLAAGLLWLIGLPGEEEEENEELAGFVTANWDEIKNRIEHR